MTRGFVAGSLVVLIVALFGCATASTSATPAPARSTAARSPASQDPDALYYQQARDALKTHDPDAAGVIDFKRFRRGSLLGGAPIMGADVELKRAIASNDEARILAAAQAMLADNAANLRAHIVASNVLHKQGKEQESKFHGVFIKGILDSIVASGDGKSAATAFTVFNVPEEYCLVQAVGLQVLRQSLHHEGSRVFDVLSVRRGNDASAPSRDLYFDITELFAEEAKALTR
jgi:hypothetical protein